MMSAQQEYLCILRLGAGEYEFGFEHLHTIVQPAAPKWDPNSTAFNYPATLVGVDHQTSGNWVGKYGSKGHVLFNYSDLGFDVVSLPSYIEHVWLPTRVPLTGGPPFPSGRSSCGGAGGFGGCVLSWGNGSTTSDGRVLENPAGPSAPRTAAAVTSKRWASFHIHVQAAENAPAFNITLYMVDYRQAKILQALKVMDSSSRPIGQMTLVEDFGGGAYVTYTSNQSMIFRVLEVPSPEGTVAGLPPRPVVSGLFFD